MRKKRKAASPKTSRRRSPNYPTVSLENAVERVGNLYQKDGPAGATREAAIKHIGFSKAHGQALSVLSALKKFGLVSVEAGRIVPTKRAINIIEFGDQHERGARSLVEAVLAPEIYKELVEQFRSHGQLPSDDSLKPELIADRGFNPKAVKGFLDDFRASLEFAGLLSDGALELPEKPDENSEVQQELLPARTALFDASSGEKDMDRDKGKLPAPQSSDWTIPLIGGKAILRAPMPLSKQNFELIQTWFKSMKPALVPQEDDGGD